MRHTDFDDWSRRTSPLHRWDARVKLVLLVVYLVTLTLQKTPARAGILAMPLFAAMLVSRLPMVSLLGRAAAVLPFTLAFAAMAAFLGDPARGGMLLGKSYLSALATALLAAVTPLPALMAAAAALGAPRPLVWIVQFVYRYLFVIWNQAVRMRQAAESRAGGQRQLLARAGAGALAVLFAGSHQHATKVHQAMLARGYQGYLPLLEPLALRNTDVWAFLASAAVVTGLPYVW